ncbi:MAG TPA: methyltransferase domain-containing protein [Polyangiaceae bacterium]|nr:methyltransferase domain-containing protein [Polyangiaceae bacterium]
MKHHPYAPIAPRLPEAETIDPREILQSGGRPIELEIGPGRGGFILERLEAAPEARMLGLEIRLKWATLVDRKLGERGLHSRARVFAEDARAAIRRFPDGCLEAVFIHFPDPWWKKRHQKRLVMGDALLAELSRTLRPGGQVFLQTDVEERASFAQALLDANPHFSPKYASARIEENPFLARSPRERRAIQDGLPIYRLLYERRAAEPAASVP